MLFRSGRMIPFGLGCDGAAGAWRLGGQPGCTDWMRPPDQVAGPRRPPAIERVRRDRCGVDHIRPRQKVSVTMSSRFRCCEALRVPCVLTSGHRFVRVEWALANPSIRFGIGYRSEGRFYVFGGDHAVARKLAWLCGCCDRRLAVIDRGQQLAIGARRVLMLGLQRRRRNVLLMQRRLDRLWTPRGPQPTGTHALGCRPKGPL